MRAFMKRLRGRALAYQRIFQGDDGDLHEDARIVLADLKHFCYVDRSTAKFSSTQTMDPVAMAYAEGRREVFLRLQAHLKLDEAQIRNIREPEYEDDNARNQWNSSIDS